MLIKKNTGFSRIDKVLNKTAKDYNLEAALYKHQTIKYWHEVASGFIEEATKLTQAIDFKKGVLTVACLSHEVANQIRILSKRIIQELNQIIGKQMVYAIYVEV